MSFVDKSAGMVDKLADGTEEKFAGTGAIRSICHEEFVTRCLSFDFAKATWLQFLDRHLVYLGVPSLEAQHVLLKRFSSPAALFVDEG